MNNFKVLNIVSGKGGTGKTLLSAVLANLLGNSGANVLVVDVDIYVRGLTALLYFHKRESLKLVTADEHSVSSLFVDKHTEGDLSESKPLGIHRYRSFDVLPAVSRIDENLNYEDILPNSRSEAYLILKTLINSISTKYDIVILDSRAGYDELIAATHELSDASICVEEEDSISRITADNLVSQLGFSSKNTVFRLTNKARGYRTTRDLDDSHRSVTELGQVPFDLDVMNSFGTSEFWDVISRSLYKAGLARAWNRLATKMEIDFKLDEARLSPIASNRLEELLGIYGFKQRILILYGITLTSLGLGYAFIGNQFLRLFQDSPERILGFSVGIAGFILLISALLTTSSKDQFKR